MGLDEGGDSNTFPVYNYAGACPKCRETIEKSLNYDAGKECGFHDDCPHCGRRVKRSLHFIGTEEVAIKSDG